MSHIGFVENLFKIAVDEKKNLWIRVGSFILLALFDQNKKDIGSLWRRPSIVNWLMSSIGLYGNINNLGNPFSKDLKDYQWLAALERQVIRACSQLIKDNSFEGYITSGGTEANIFLMWAGKETFVSEKIKKYTLVLSSFGHYSLLKGSRILGIDQKVISTFKSGGVHDVDLFEREIVEQYKLGYRGFLVPLTIGYSSTGLSDPISEMISVINKLQIDLEKSRFFIWIDAAAQGLVKSFLDESFSPTRNSLVKGYVVDFHKFGQVPLPAGVVLYRPELRPLIESKINYLHEADATLLGSRPGFSVLGIWSALFMKKKDYWKHEMQRLEQKKCLFIKKLKNILPSSTVYSEKNSLTIGIAINQYFPKLRSEIEEKFGLVECEIDGLRHYKIHFLK